MVDKYKERKKRRLREKRAKKRRQIGLFILLIVLIIALVFFVKNSNNESIEKRENEGVLSSENESIAEESKDTIQSEKRENNTYTDDESKKAIKEGSIYSKTFNKDKPFDHLEKNNYVREDEDQLIEDLPESSKESIVKYPEAKNELLQYSEWKEYHENYDLTGVYKKGDIPRFIQWDSRWAFYPLGTHNIAYAGCGPTALSSAYIYLTGDTSMNPVVMSKWAEDNRYYDDAYGTSWDVWTDGASKLGINGKAIDFNLDKVKEELDNGALIILSVAPGDFTYTGHYIMIVGYSGDNLIIHDVNSPRNSSVLWNFDRISQQVKSAWSLNE